MNANIPITELSRRIQGLVNQRQQYVDAIAQIDLALANVSVVLKTVDTNHKVKSSAAIVGMKLLASGGKRRRKQGTFAMTGEESILAFVQKHRNPTTQQIKQHWQNDGRGGKVSPYLSEMVKEKKLKRTPLGNILEGSRYSLP